MQKSKLTVQYLAFTHASAWQSLLVITDMCSIRVGGWWWIGAHVGTEQHLHGMLGDGVHWPHLVIVLSGRMALRALRAFTPSKPALLLPSVGMKVV